MAIHLLHLGLPVRDQQRSTRFYATWFGFDPDGARRYPDGTVILRNPDGFDLALHLGEAPEHRQRLQALPHHRRRYPTCRSGPGSLVPAAAG